MAFCTKCGKEIQQDAAFCPACGASRTAALGTAAPAPAAKAATVAATWRSLPKWRKILLAGTAGAFALFVLTIIMVALLPPDSAKDSSPGPSPTVNSPADKAPSPWTQVHLTPEQKMEGRRALCDAVREEWPDVEAGTQGKDKFPLILAIQSFSLEGADNKIADAAVRTAFADYLGYEWDESACPESAHQQATGELDEPLPKGAINIALVKTARWWYPDTR